MTEQTISTGAIARAVQAAEVDGLPLSPHRLCDRLRRMTDRLKQEYTRAAGCSLRQPVEEWLCGNYYLLERESKQCIQTIRRSARRENHAELMRVYHVFSRVLEDCMPPLGAPGIAAVLAEMDKICPLRESQLAFAPTAIQAALVEMAYRAVFRTGSEQQIAYAVTGFHRLAGVDMQAVIHACSSVEAILLRDPAEVYADMSDESRGVYRRSIARIAAAAGQTEQQTAKLLLKEAVRQNVHIGALILHHPTLTARRTARGKAALIFGVLLPLLVCVLAGEQTDSLWCALLLFLPLWEILRLPIQQLALRGVEADYIPRMDLARVENKPKTAVLVSTLLPGAADLSALADRLERLYYADGDADMLYGVLADPGEWDEPTDEKDDARTRAAKRMVEALNRKHGQRFLLFVRGRVYSPTQQRYSGWERKRGAITEFIRFCKGEETSLHTFVGDRDALKAVKFLLALDADTELLYESAQMLVSAALHPLNRPVVKNGVVVSGYGILAPRIGTDLASARKTAFSRAMNGCGGVTAYETRSKDFYQDLFGESIFAGKGLIDVDAFYTVLNDRFPEGRILSHDILEGAYLRCGFVSDVEMTDSAPAGMSAWLARLHRWQRGDWQNLVFLFRRCRIGGTVWENPISALNRYQLLDNLRRALTPPAALVCLTAALFVSPPAAVWLAVCGGLAVVFPSLWAAGWSLISGRWAAVGRRFFARTLPRTVELLVQAVLLLIMLPAQAFLALDAMARSLWRSFVSGRHLLEWTTAAQAEKHTGRMAVVRRYAPAELFGLWYFAAAYPSALTPVGVCFALVLPAAVFSARPIREPDRTLHADERETLLSYNAAMWRYYEDYATAEHHFLPPDNVQQSPVYRVAARTSPTNIGMFLLSALAAYDFGFIDAEGLFQRIQRTFSTVELLKLWKGNLYNWYDTETLAVLEPAFVSTVDSGNFVCCLVALSGGLRELLPEHREFADLIRRIDAMVDATDLAPLYDENKRLFTIGCDVGAKRLSDSHYDFLMSEARMTSYFAVARKVVDKKHWGALSRTMSRCGGYAGPVSWTGTMFEYFMPHLLLPIPPDSLLGESLSYALYGQKRRAAKAGVPWGISESAFYAFDDQLNYQYKAHGVQTLGVKQGLDEELVISPYSTLLALPFAPHSAMKNLARLRAMGAYGRCGFYEAVDFTAQRVGEGSFAIIRSYMAHHIGMSMIASCNALFGGRMQDRFMREGHMHSAAEFLQEKIAKDTVVYDPVRENGDRRQTPQRPRQSAPDRTPNPTAPRCTVLTNGELTAVMSDIGAEWLCFGGADLTRRENDLLRRAQGILTIARMNGVTLPAAAAPFYDPDAHYRTEQDGGSVTAHAKKGSLALTVRTAIHSGISCLQRRIAVRNESGAKQLVELLCYLEPVLAPYADYSAHPAYAKLFVTVRHDRASRTLSVCRRNRDSTTDLFLTIGFLEDIDFTFETRREALMAAPNGVQDLLHFTDRPFADHEGGVPDACCALRFDLLVAPGTEQQATLLISAARSAGEGLGHILRMRRQNSAQAAGSPLPGDPLTARLSESALGRLLMTTADCTENCAEKEKNTLGQPGLWPLGISGDYPILLVEDAADGETVSGWLRLHTSLRRIGLFVDLVALCPDDTTEAQLHALVERMGAASFLSARGGIFLLRADTLSEEQRILLRASARHIAGTTLPEPTAPFRPVRLRSVAPAPMPENPDLAVEGGAFADGRFYVNKTSPLPWCHILANGPFGTLVSDTSPGYTWAVNSRENKLTPWHNDITTDNTGEMALLFDGEDYFHLTHGARASFAAGEARYDGRTASVGSTVTITISETGCAKYIDITLHNRTGHPLRLACAYFLEPVLGVNRDSARHIRAGQRGDVLVLHNPYNTAVRCFAALTASGGEQPRFTTDRAAFLCGGWQEGVCSTNDPCAAVIVPVTLGAGEETHLRFTLAYGATADSAVLMATKTLAKRKPSGGFVRICTPDPRLNELVNHFLPGQIMASRIRGRTAFYQCGGAYGFRDQLQDVCAVLLLDPSLARRQILRCCAVQFEEGDVLHWWHPLPQNAGGLKGVRTRFSDDLLWLPWAVSEYVRCTGDTALLSVPVRYLRAEPLNGGEQEKYLSPQRSTLREDVYHHCIRAIERGDNPGQNGLPRIGCGDWNDGFSAVGVQGEGTSVWLALFLALVLRQFAPLCAGRGDTAREQQYLARAEELIAAVDRHAWDGKWYLRAFFDDGEPMGSCAGAECKIDLLPQSFAVFAGMPDRERVGIALDSALVRLVEQKLRLVQLFSPPFQHSAQQPGYVKAYPSGLRENGGQYTHAAVWFAMALMQFGRTADGWRVLEMLLPIDRGEHYKLEPYLIAADVYASRYAPGRGGWSMYTGAASWTLRAVLETLLGLARNGDTLTLAPHLPPHWPGAEIDAEIAGTRLHICIKTGSGGMLCDGAAVQTIPLDGAAHEVVVFSGEK